MNENLLTESVFYSPGSMNENLSAESVCFHSTGSMNENLSAESVLAV